MKVYKVQSHHPDLGWRTVSFAESYVKAYCEGWIDCMSALTPSPPMRLVSIDGDQTRVIRETKGRGEPHTN